MLNTVLTMLSTYRFRPLETVPSRQDQYKSFDTGYLDNVKLAFSLLKHEFQAQKLSQKVAAVNKMIRLSTASN